MFVSQLAGFYTKRFKAGQIMTKRLGGRAPKEGGPPTFTLRLNLV